MVFGTFDGVHDGHRHLFNEAINRGDELYVVVARDEHVLELKGHLPNNMIAARMELVECESEVTEVIMGDEELGSYNVILEVEPSLIIFGYDQDDFRHNLMAWLEDNNITNISTEQASAHMPEVFSSSMLAAEMGEEIGAI